MNKKPTTIELTEADLEAVAGGTHTVEQGSEAEKAEKHKDTKDDGSGGGGNTATSGNDGFSSDGGLGGTR